MQKSNDTSALFEALAKAQGEIKTAELDGKNPHFNSRYATLTSVRNACRGPLSQNKLAVIQTVESEEGGFVVTSMLTHSSGQWISSTMRLLIGQQTMQGLGSAITYAKRYALAAMVGVVDEDDDDGNRASAAPPRPAPKKPITKPSPSVITQEAPPPEPVERPVRNEAPVSPGQVRAIVQLCKDRNVSPAVMNKFLTDVYKIESSKFMKTWQADEIVQLLSEETTNETTLMAKCSAMLIQEKRFAPPGAGA